jgi:MFS family permease
LQTAASSSGATAPRKAARKLYHGWVIVSVALIAGAFTTGAGTWGVSLFVKPMTDELGWSRAAFFGALTMRSVMAGVLAPVIGPLQDSGDGPRRLMFITALGMSAGMAALALVDSLVAFYILFGVVGTLMTVGGAEMLLSVVLPKWFVRRRTQAMTIASAGQGAGPLFFPILLSAVIDEWGWRVGWLALGGAAFVILFPLAFTIRTRPEDMGLHPDGDDAPLTAAGAPLRRSEERSFTRSEAVREPTFWMLNLSGALFIMGVTGLQTNWLLYFQDIGFASTTAALSATAFGIGSFSSRFLWGFFAGRFQVRLLMAVATSLTALTVFLLFQVDSVALMIAAALLNGLALGGNFVMRPLIVANYFGRAHIGAINGLMRPLMIAGSATGPLLVAALFDITGDWHVAFGLVAAIWFASAGSIALARAPRPRPEATA